MAKSQKELETQIENQKNQLTRYETRLKDLVVAYKGLLNEKAALETSLASFTTKKSESLGSSNEVSTPSAAVSSSAAKVSITEDGRDLIRQFVSGPPASDNEIAASEQQEVIQPADAVESEENAKSADNPINTAMQYFYQPQTPDMISQLAAFGIDPVTADEQYENETVETTTSANFVDRISQWASFLNPLANRQEIPIPPSRAELNGNIVGPLNVNDEFIANQNTVPLPELPELPPLPSIPGAEHPPPPLPTVHIPVRYIGPQIPYTNGVAPPAGGPYVRLRLPLSAFNPTSSYQIDPKYLPYAQEPLQQQAVVQSPFVPNAPAPGIRLYQGSSPDPFVKTLQLPTISATPFVSQPLSASIVSLAPNFPSLLDQRTANGLQFFPPQIAPFAKPLYIANPPTPGLQLPTAVVGQFREPVSSTLIEVPEHYVQAASGKVKHTVPVDASSQFVPNNIHVISNVGNDRLRNVARSSSNTDIVADGSYNDEGKQFQLDDEKNSSVTDSASNSNSDSKLDSQSNSESDDGSYAGSDSESNAMKFDEDEQIEQQPLVDYKPPTKTPYESMRPKLKMTKKPIDVKHNAQRYLPKNSYATGKMYRADGKAINMLPFTVRQMVKTTNIDYLEE